MSTRFDLSMELQEWLATATPQQILERLDNAEWNAYLWHVVRTCMKPEDVDQLQLLASELLAGGYRPELVASVDDGGMSDGHSKPTLVQRLMSAVRRK